MIICDCNYLIRKVTGQNKFNYEEDKIHVK